MIHAARALRLRVMLGCMIESELGIAAAAQIACLADDVDLDGHLLIVDPPFAGLGFKAGRVTPSSHPGLGVRPAR
jgi:L-alanine-DL-glutamate epimerase-like enolase superfamily enzyme